MTTEAAEQTGEAPASGAIVARAARYYRLTRYLITVVLLGYGAWCIHDGFYSWPNWPITHPQDQPKTQADILLNKGMGVLLPPLGIIVLVRMLRNSRGEYRMENGIIKVPGHPPIPIDKIQAVDRKEWDRKGIALIDYDLTEVASVAKAGAPVQYQGVIAANRGTFKLDDFVYERTATDQIFEAIEASVLKAATRPPEPKPAVAVAPAKPAPKSLAAAKAAQARPATGGPPAGKPPTPPPPAKLR